MEERPRAADCRPGTRERAARGPLVGLAPGGGGRRCRRRARPAAIRRQPAGQNEGREDSARCGQTSGRPAPAGEGPGRGGRPTAAADDGQELRSHGGEVADHWAPGQRGAELKGSVGEGPNQTNYSDRSSVRILAKLRNSR